MNTGTINAIHYPAVLLVSQEYKISYLPGTYFILINRSKQESLTQNCFY